MGAGEGVSSLRIFEEPRILLDCVKARGEVGCGVRRGVSGDVKGAGGCRRGWERGWREKAEEAAGEYIKQRGSLASAG